MLTSASVCFLFGLNNNNNYYYYYCCCCCCCRRQSSIISAYQFPVQLASEHIHAFKMQKKAVKKTKGKEASTLRERERESCIHY
jgi:hypothetical protein